MKNIRYTLIGLILIITNTYYSIGQTNNTQLLFVKGEVLVQLKNSYTEKDLGNAILELNHDFKIRKKISEGLNAYLVSFEDPSINNFQAQEAIWKIPFVINVQNNHFVEDRETLPNDTQFPAQWFHKNTGASGSAVADADIDTPDAWDITTGGLTSFGDTIVVAILEGGGGDMTHSDIADNAWFNYAEIPNNGIDDDGNGYIDDFKGWDVSSNNDNIGSANHGTAVMGMIGAKGDNNNGVTGVNWNVKMMMISGFSATNEADVLEAYDYPLKQRKIYNNTNGNEGAFVVVTNASWGLNNGQPSDAPLWCAMYDTLGTYGILSIGATSNSNVNVDTDGDLPTACPSNYLISVTATDHKDERTFSGYGPTHIDIGAPGDNVFLPANTNSYGTTTGTSFASPCTAGAVALLYSAPCPSFMADVHDDPAATALVVRQYIFDGTDYSAYLAGEVATDGRLNVKNSLDLLLADCTSGCVYPYADYISNITDTEATINWDGLATQGYVVEIRQQGVPTWTTVNESGFSLLVDTLTACTTYEVKIKALCDAGAESDYSDILTFTTDGCCENPSTLDLTATNSTVTATWTSVLAAQSYDIRYKLSSTSTWTEELNVTSPHIVTGLDTCESYDLEIRTVCTSQTLSYDNLITISTSGCGACLDEIYCLPTIGTVDYEYIESIIIGNLNNNSGTNNGYVDFGTQFPVNFEAGKTIPVTITPGYNGFSYTERFRVYLDINQNGIFDNNEELFSQTNNGTVSGSINIPVSALTGLTKMRVFMADQSETPSPCISESYYGEIEDYCVTILESSEPVSGVSIDEFSNEEIGIFPNPSNGKFNIQTDKNYNYDIIDINGKVILKSNLNKGLNNINLINISKGVYFIQCYDNNNLIQAVKKLIIQ